MDQMRRPIRLAEGLEQAQTERLWPAVSEKKRDEARDNIEKPSRGRKRP